MSKLKLLGRRFINSLRPPLYRLQTTQMYSIQDKPAQPSPPRDKRNAMLVDGSTSRHTPHAVRVRKRIPSAATNRLLCGKPASASPCSSPKPLRAQDSARWPWRGAQLVRADDRSPARPPPGPARARGHSLGQRGRTPTVTGWGVNATRLAALCSSPCSHALSALPSAGSTAR